MKNQDSARFQSFECDPVAVPPGTPAAPRLRDRAREMPWVFATLEKIQALTYLERGWDSHDGLPLSTAARHLAFDVVAGLMHQDLPVPGVVLGSDGTLHLEWQWRGKELKIGLGEADTFEFVKVDALGHVEEGEGVAVTQDQLDTLVIWLKAG